MIMKMRDMLKRKNGQKGFTLVELIVVMAILAVLAAIAVPRYNDVTTSAKIGAALANHRTLVSTVVMAQTESAGELPATGIDTLAAYIQGGKDSIEGSEWTVVDKKGTLVTTVDGESAKYPEGTKGNIVTAVADGKTTFTTEFTVD